MPGNNDTRHDGEMNGILMPSHPSTSKAPCNEISHLSRNLLCCVCIITSRRATLAVPNTVRREQATPEVDEVDGWRTADDLRN